MTVRRGYTLETQLAQRERELALVAELDRIQDEWVDTPQQALAPVIGAVTKALRADAGLLAYLDDAARATIAAQSGEDTLLSALDRGALDQVARASASLHTASALEPGDDLGSKGVRALLCAPLNVGAGQTGSLVFLSRQRRFEGGDVSLLTVAARQVGSTLRQARSWQDLQACRKEIQESSRQLNAAWCIDRIRDQATDASQFVIQVIDVLTESLDADVCMVGLAHKDQEGVALEAFKDRLGVVRSLPYSDLQKVLYEALSAGEVCMLHAGVFFAEQKLEHVCAAPLIVNGTGLGAFVLANREKAFSIADLDVLQAVASQADSALAHLRTLEEMRERAQQLEAIYRIDRIRDEASGAQDILPSVVDLVMDAVGADLCLMSLINEETGESELKAVEDRQSVFGNLDRHALQQAIEWAFHQDEVGVLRTGSPLGRWNLDHLIGAPLVVARERLGALLLARGQKPFGRPERDLVRAVISQTDSAIIHARTENHLRQRQKELETLYRIDHIRDQGYEFGEMLSAVLNELCAAINAEMGFVMLFDREGKQLELRASTDDDLLESTGHYSVINRAANEALYSGQLYAAEGLTAWLRAIMCVPLILQERIIGVFGACNHRGTGGFTAEDRRLLLAITSQVDTAIFESLDKQRIRETFQRYVGPTVMEQMLTTPEKDFLKVERAVLTVLFSDMRGFTRMSERVDADVLVEMINTHLGTMTGVVLSNRGTLDKFVADEVMAIFGAPLPMQDHARQAILTALQMQEAQRALMARWNARGYSLPTIGIGINTGEMVVGNIGCEQQMDYTVLGDVVNLASRLCDAAAGGQILITEATYMLVADEVRAERLPEIHVKGKEHPVQIYQVIGLA
jgi:adenylate cyclase